MLDAQRLAEQVELMVARRLTFAGSKQPIGERLAVVGEQPLDLAGTGLVQRREKGMAALAGGDGSRQISEKEATVARYQGRRVAELAVRLAG